MAVTNIDPMQPATPIAVADPFKLRPPREVAAETKPLVHLIRNGVRCGTEKRGYPNPDNKSRERLVVDATEGFIPLWASDTTLRWRFQERSMRYFANPAAAKNAIEALLGEALVKWGDAMPVRFVRNDDLWDFEVVMSASDDCDGNACVLASAFFPDPGRHELWMYPKMFTQTRPEQIDTFVHEFGHVFGLRHFFAQVTETRWASEIFGEHKPFSIMNYGDNSVLTETDKSDLQRLYELAWSGELTDVNGTPIRFVRPFHTAGLLGPSDGMVGLAPAAFQGVCPPVAAMTYARGPALESGTAGGKRSGNRGGRGNGATPTARGHGGGRAHARH